MLPDVITAAPRHITGRGRRGLHVAGATRGPATVHNSSESWAAPPEVKFLALLFLPTSLLCIQFVKTSDNKRIVIEITAARTQPPPPACLFWKGCLSLSRNKTGCYQCSDWDHSSGAAGLSWKSRNSSTLLPLCSVSHRTVCSTGGSALFIPHYCCLIDKERWLHSRLNIQS